MVPLRPVSVCERSGKPPGGDFSTLKLRLPPGAKRGRSRHLVTRQRRARMGFVIYVGRLDMKAQQSAHDRFVTIGVGESACRSAI